MCRRLTGIPAGFATRRVRRLKLGGHSGRAGVPNRVVSIGVLRHQAEHPRLGAADPDWRAVRPWAARTKLALPGLIVLPGEVDGAFAKERNDDLQGFGEAAGQMIEWIAVSVVLRLVPPRSETEDEPSPTYVVDGIGDPRELGRIAVSRCTRRTDQD